MPFRKIYECICDYCGECNYHIYDKSGLSLKDLRDAGYVVTMNGIYCCKDCYNKAKKKGIEVARYASQNQLIKQTGFTQGLVSAVLNGKRNHHKGYTFKYESEAISNIHEPPKDFRPEHLKRMGVSISKGGEG